MRNDLFDPESRADQIYARFVTFHAENPIVWTLFVRYALQLIASGREHYGVAAIIERVRWHVNVEIVGSEVKINNDFRAYYARMFMAKYPEHAGFFGLRRRTSAERPAFENDIAVFHVGQAAGEKALMDSLRRLPG